MPDWFAITGAITNAATAVDLAYRYSPPEVIHGKDAGKMLQEVDYILKHSNSVLENHKDIMDGDAYEGFKDKYRVFHWQMADESQGHRAIRDQIIRQSRILSQLYASEQSREHRAKKLLQDVEQYQTDVLSASQAAHQTKRGKPLAMFPDIKNSPRSPELTPTSSSFNSWLSKRSATPSDIESVGSSEAPSLSRSSTATGSSNASIDEEEKYIVAITHIPAEGTNADPGSAPSTGLYHRVISYKSEGELVAVMERETRMLNEDEVHVDEDTLRSMFLSGKKHLSSRRMQGASLTDNAPGLLLESTVEEFKQMSTN